MKSPYPYFGGKSAVAAEIWRRFGDVPMYIEPFFGSGAVLLNRPAPVNGTETVNDFDGLIANFWRAVKHAPAAVAEYADWPVNENDLHARHAWLVGVKDTLAPRLEGDPDWYDAKIAGWWVWGMSLWIGSGFCSGGGPWSVQDVEGSRQLVHLSGAGQGVNRKLVHLGNAGRGVNRQRVHLSGAGQGVNRKLVHLGNAGRGVNRQRVHLGDAGQGNAGDGDCGLLAWMEALAERLARVRVCCGDWRRVCGGKSGDALNHFFATGTTAAVFLDPPYSADANRDNALYRCEDLDVAHDVREWCIAHGDDPRLRICLAGYEGEHAMPENWSVFEWKAAGGMSSVGADDDSRSKANAHRERLWFSPHCVGAVNTHPLFSESLITEGANL